MPLNKILVDSGFLYALYDRNEQHNEEALAVAELYSGQFVIPYVVLTEAAFLFRRAGGVPAVVRFLAALVSAEYEYAIVTPEDLARTRDIMAQYADAKLDFVDCCIMAYEHDVGKNRTYTIASSSELVIWVVMFAT